MGRSNGGGFLGGFNVNIIIGNSREQRYYNAWRSCATAMSGDIAVMQWRDCVSS
jgi:hypothetical protein